MKLDVKNQKNEVIEQIDVSDKIFNLKLNPETVYQVYVSMLSNRRQPLAHTKDRSEVSGGGKKPWKQKGTGRARAGSTRSPIWRHGGITFGPRYNEQNLKKSINQKMKQKALFMVLSEKVRNNEFVIVDKIELKEEKTKEVESIIKTFLGKFKKENKQIYLIADNAHKNLIRASRNLPYIYVTLDNSIDLITVLNYKKVFITKNAIENMVKTFKKA